MNVFLHFFFWKDGGPQNERESEKLYWEKIAACETLLLMSYNIYNSYTNTHLERNGIVIICIEMDVKEGFPFPVLLFFFVVTYKHTKTDMIIVIIFQ